MTENNSIAAITELYAGWRAAVTAGNIDGYVAVLHDDVTMMPPGAADVVSAASYRAFLGPVFATATYAIEIISPPAIDVVGDIAVARYEYAIVLTLKNPERAVTEPGALTDPRTVSRYFDVLRRNANGRWAVWRHTWNASPNS